MVERQNAGENGLMTAKRRQRGMSQPGGKMPKDAKKCTVVAKKHVCPHGYEVGTMSTDER